MDSSAVAAFAKDGYAEHDGVRVKVNLSAAKIPHCTRRFEYTCHLHFNVVGRKYPIAIRENNDSAYLISSIYFNINLNFRREGFFYSRIREISSKLIKASEREVKKKYKKNQSTCPKLSNLFATAAHRHDNGQIKIRPFAPTSLLTDSFVNTNIRSAYGSKIFELLDLIFESYTNRSFVTTTIWKLTHDLAESWESRKNIFERRIERSAYRARRIREIKAPRGRNL
ncbi:hypothetical protein PUN28_013747 [Cardiocondyla obscurior]|uniref:Uncharacterized protein n=1 Tax=Cardiocondyla obscurior TaxID=286306 RepID=A0AAW2F621_9HYME